jgi:hypothetical protein
VPGVDRLQRSLAGGERIHFLDAFGGPVLRVGDRPTDLDERARKRCGRLTFDEEGEDPIVAFQVAKGLDLGVHPSDPGVCREQTTINQGDASSASLICWLKLP